MQNTMVEGDDEQGKYMGLGKKDRKGGGKQKGDEPPPPQKKNVPPCGCKIVFLGGII